MAADALSGQTALVPLPDVRRKLVSDASSSISSEAPSLPAQLRIDSQTSKKKRGGGSGTLGNGMDVIKIGDVSLFVFFRINCSSLSTPLEN